MRVLVLGGTQFIGLAAVRRLAELGHDLLVFHRGQTQASLPDGVQVLHGDRKQLHNRIAEFRAFNPEVVLDMLAFTEDDGRQLLEAFSGVARRLVVISSGESTAPTTASGVRILARLTPRPLPKTRRFVTSFILTEIQLQDLKT